jgi:polysaccharide export outer membrane protein
VLISVTEIQSKKVVVSGAVSNPGFFTLGTNITITDALAQAGGVATDANRGSVYLIRRNGAKGPEVVEFDYKYALNNGDFSRDLMLRNGDIVYVPRTKLATLATIMSQVNSIIDPVVRVESGIVLWPDVKAVIKGDAVSPDNVTVVSP